MNDRTICERIHAVRLADGHIFEVELVVDADLVKCDADLEVLRHKSARDDLSTLFFVASSYNDLHVWTTLGELARQVLEGSFGDDDEV
jgi:hypothetical protein